MGPLLVVFVTTFCISKAGRSASSELCLTHQVFVFNGNTCVTTQTTCSIDHNDSWLVAVAAAAFASTEVQCVIYFEERRPLTAAHLKSETLL